MDATPTGPYVRAALFCERVLVEKDNVKSLVRIIDRVTQKIVGPMPPDAPVPFEHFMHLVVMLTPGSAKGRAEFAVTVEPPSGVGAKTLGSGSLHFEGATRPVDIVINLKTRFEQEGVYWYTFLLDGKPLTRIAFDVRYERVATAGSEPNRT